MNSFFPGGRRRAASWFFLVLTIASVLCTIGCRNRSSAGQGIAVRNEISPWPARQGEATVSFQLADSNAYPVSHARISVEGDMAHPGMAPVFSDAHETSPGSYEAHVNFSMGGDWVLLLHVTLADGRKFDKQVDVKGVESR